MQAALIVTQTSVHHDDNFPCKKLSPLRFTPNLRRFIDLIPKNCWLYPNKIYLRALVKTFYKVFVFECVAFISIHSQFLPPLFETKNKRQISWGHSFLFLFLSRDFVLYLWAALRLFIERWPRMMKQGKQSLRKGHLQTFGFSEAELK